MIKNKVKGITLSYNTKYANTLFKKTIGLMFTRKNDYGLIFNFEKEQIIGLHMFFVFYPIDVLWLNEKKEVVFKKKNFKPFTWITPNVKAKYVIELPINTIKKTEIKDIISWT